MSKLIHLVRRDLMVHKRERSLVVPALLCVAAAIFLESTPGFAVGLITTVVYHVVVYTNAYDFKYNVQLGYRSLPIPRASLIVSRYLSALLIFILSTAISILASAAVRTAGLFNVTRGWTLSLVALAFCTVGLYFSVYFPIYFRLGYMKSRWATYFLLLSLYTGLGALQGLGAQVGGGAVTAQIFSGAVDAPVLAAAVLGTSAVLALSMFVSIKIDQGREL